MTAEIANCRTQWRFVPESSASLPVARRRYCRPCAPKNSAKHWLLHSRRYLDLCGRARARTDGTIRLVDRSPATVTTLAIADTRSVAAGRAGGSARRNDGVLLLRATDASSLVLIGPGELQTFAIVTGQERRNGRAGRQIGAQKALRPWPQGVHWR